MIQRIQSLFLLASAMFLAFSLFFPYAEMIRNTDQVLFQLDFNGLSPLQPDGQTIFKVIPLNILLLVSLAVNILIIFLFRKRMLQIRLCVFLTIMLLGAPALTYYYIRMAQTALPGEASYGITFVFPVVSAILVFLALRAIARDEALVRSLDRLR